jgi:hypothetical protein
VGQDARPVAQAGFSGQDRLDHRAVHVGEPALDAVVVEREPGVVEPEEVQDRGVEVVERGESASMVVGSLAVRRRG